MKCSNHAPRREAQRAHDFNDLGGTHLGHGQV
jgi:hypothetical protein